VRTLPPRKREPDRDNAGRLCFAASEASGRTRCDGLARALAERSFRITATTLCGTDVHIVRGVSGAPGVVKVGIFPGGVPQGRGTTELADVRV